MSEELTLPLAARPQFRRHRSAPVGIRQTLDTLVQGASTAGALAMMGLLLLLAIVLFAGAYPAIKEYGFGFLIHSEWDPVEMHFGALPVIYGTLVSSLLALCIAVPMSLGAALFLTRLAPRWIVTPVSFLIEVLAAIPSITYGFWGVAVLIPFLQKTGQPFLKGALGHVPLLGGLFSGASYGFSMLAAGLVLAIMVLPIITAVTQDVLRAVPKEIEEGAYALGATWWQAGKAVIGYGKLGIFGAIILGFARAIGETMAVTMVIGNTNAISLSLLKPGQTMASLLANEFLEADKPLYLRALVYIAFVLLVLTILLNGLARVLVTRVTSGQAPDQKPLPPTPSRSGEGAGEKPTPSHSGEGVGGGPAALAEAARNGPAPTAQPTVPKRRISIRQVCRSARLFSAAFKGLCAAAAILAIALLVMIIGYVIYKGSSSLNWDFFTKLPGPVGTPTGMRNAILGTLILIGLGSAIGIPLGMLCGIYLSEYAKAGWFSNGLRLVVDVLAGTPSIVVGVLAYELVVLQHGQLFGIGLGFSGWAGSIALAFLMCPIIARTTEEMLRLVPHHQREASLGLGGAQYQTLLGVVIPAASTGIITGIMLSVARIAGETAPLLFTALGNDSDVYNPAKPFPALTLKIFQYATSAEPEWIRQAWAGMLVLVAMILLLSAAVRYVSRGRTALVV
ncbi:MAG: phosphate ABC transporter permease PstA [Planctomycetota bacterium]